LDKIILFIGVLMKYIKYVLLIYLITHGICFSQSFQVFDVDTSNFPNVKAKFLVYSNNWQQIVNLSASDFKVFENGIERHVTNVNCPQIKPEQISSVLTIDVSGSMCLGGLDMAKAAAKAWINALNLNPSQCAITSFSDYNFFVKDFTDDRNILLNRIDNLSCYGGTDYDKAMIEPVAGAILTANKGKFKRIIVFISDGQPNFQPNETEIINEAKANNITIYCLTVGNPSPDCLKHFAEKTGGLWFENISTDKDAIDAYLKILNLAQKVNLCTLEWQSGTSCQSNDISVDVKLLSDGSIASSSYMPPSDEIEKMVFHPFSTAFSNIAPGNQKDTIIKVTAQNGDFNVTNIVSNNPQFSISPKSFNLKSGTSRDLTVSFTPSDSGYTYAKFSFITDLCPATFYANGGFFGKGPTQSTLKLSQPNGGEIYVIGTDSIITWEGIPETDTVKLDYSSNNGADWQTIIYKTSGLKYLWKNIPKPKSNQCLVNVSQFGDYATDSSKLILTLKGHTEDVWCVKWSPDGSKIASGSCDNTIKIWDGISGDLLKTITGHNNCVRSIDWSPDGSKVASASYDKTIKIWDTQSWNLIMTITGHSNEVKGVNWSPNGSKIASCSSDKTIKIWNSSNGNLIATLAGHGNYVQCVNWSPDGLKLASGSMDNTIKVWDAIADTLIYTIKGHTLYVEDVNWSPNGKKIVSGSQDDNIKVWDAATGNLLVMMSEQTMPVNSVNWSPDGNRIASGSNDKTIKIFDAATGYHIKSLYGHTSNVVAINWNPDGTKIVSGSSDGNVKIWLKGEQQIIQQDVSDSVFSIVAPSLTISDIDVQQCLIGSTKDTIINTYLKNAGIYKTKIDSIYISGADAAKFQAVCSIFPFYVEPGKSKSIEIRFSPGSTGIKKAKINILTASDLYTQDISGEGVKPQLRVINNLINFGEVPVNSTKDTTVTLIIRNVTNGVVNISNTIQLGPDSVQFTIKSGGGAFSLPPNSSRNMELMFAPTVAGRTSGMIGFEYSGIGSPATIALFGEGIVPTLEVDSIEGKPGDTVQATIYLRKSQNIIQSGTSGYTADLSFNASLLLPLVEQKGSVANGLRTIPLNLPLSDMINDEIKTIKFIVCLGNDTISPLTLSNILPVGGNVPADNSDGVFKLLGVCREGGPRLIDANGKVQLMDCIPNPAGEKVQFEFETIEKGNTELYVSDLLGNKILKIFESIEPGNYVINYDLSPLPNGTYIYTLQTPTKRMSKLFVIDN
jgi:WD40 repeat protein